jgi:hypothetical protein
VYAGDAMNDLEHLAGPGMDLRKPRRQILFGPGRTKKLAAYILSALITVAMVMWIGVLSWGLFTTSQWLLVLFRWLWSSL